MSVQMLTLSARSEPAAIRAHAQRVDGTRLVAVPQKVGIVDGGHPPSPPAKSPLLLLDSIHKILLSLMPLPLARDFDRPSNQSSDLTPCSQ